jgi:hypothetical protein
MGEIIPLPNQKRKRHQPQTWQVEKLTPPPHDHAHSFDFTCVTCKNKSTLKLHNAVLKNMEIYCESCGTGWKICNPVFAVKRDTGI